MKIKNLTLASLFIAIGVISSQMFYIPIGVSKVFPAQHIINVLSAVLFGPSYAILVAFVVSLLRNVLGTGSILAFPGSMIGAFLAGLAYKKTQKLSLSAFSEVIGTGVIGALVSFPLAKYFLGKEVGAFFFIGPFIVSSLAGAIIAYFVLKVLHKTEILNKEPRRAK